MAIVLMIYAPDSADMPATPLSRNTLTLQSSCRHFFGSSVAGRENGCGGILSNLISNAETEEKYWRSFSGGIEELLNQGNLPISQAGFWIPS